MTQWINVAPLSAIPKLGSRIVESDDGPIAVFRTDDNEVFALLNRCPHKGGPLSEGIVYGKTVACPLHDWCIALNSGEAVAPDEGCTPHYPVKVEEGQVYLCLQAIESDLAA